MTLPEQRTRAVLSAREFLVRLINPSLPDGAKRVPKSIRQEASRLLRHYPGVVDMHEAGTKAPAVFDPEEAWRVYR